MLNHIELLLARSPVLAPGEVYYPESDGQPMGETSHHINVILYLLAALRYFFRRAEQVYVGANMLFYYVEGDPTSYRVPDVFVVKGVPEHERRVYKLWEEGATPAVIFEISSKSTRHEDTGLKKGLYEMLGVREYFVFDPLNEYLKPQLQGWLLHKQGYQPISPSSDGALISLELGLILKPEARFLRLIDPATRRPIPTLDEAAEQIEREIARAEAETRQAKAAARRAEAEAQRAETEAKRAETEAQRAETEAQRADQAEAEIARLRAELEQLRRPGNDA